MNFNRKIKQLILVGYDLIIASISFLVALALSLETIDYFYLPDTYIGILFAIIGTLSSFLYLGLYNSISRYVSIETAMSITVGSFLSCIILLLCILLFNLKIPIPVPLIFGVILFILLGGTRMLIRYLSQKTTQKNRENVAICGAGNAGVQLMGALMQNPYYSVKLFIDDDPELDGRNLGGIDIISFNRVKETLRRKEIKTMFLVNSLKANSKQLEILDIVSEYPIKVKIIPSISKLIDSQLTIDQLKDIKIEDLLGRHPVVPNDELMTKTISNKIVLVTGAGGSIGSELCRQIIILKPKKLVMMDISEFAIYKLFEELKNYSSNHEFDLIPVIGSIQDRIFIKNLFDHFKFDTIYHAAAYKHVPLMEQNIMQCINNNIFGTLNVVELSITTKVKNFILVSTDKAVNPTSFMGASKRIAEIICQVHSQEQKNTYISIVRFGNVLGSSGSVVPLFKRQIENGGPITLTHLDITRFFMTIPEAAQLLIQAGSITKEGGIFVLDMGKPIKILDLAKRMIYLSGKQPILNKNKNLKDNEIAINITGLRPGEKLFEELSYNSNLLGTTHPRIYTAIETSMKSEELQSLLRFIKDSIINNDYQKLFKSIVKVCHGVPDFKTSIDVFIKKNDYKKT
ncbi:polysaccharide biosynthesis protein [Alphaproteobacteria bacterium]|nr:polysaccharide biosynthesis protein [Alphaproteobacteria bacterium]